MLSEILGLQIAPQRIFKFHPPLLEFYGRPFCTANVLSLKNSTYWLLLFECFVWSVPNRSELPSQHWHCQLQKTLRRLEMAMAGFWIMGRDDYCVLWSLGPPKAGCGTTVLMFRYLWRTHNNIQSFSLRFRDAHSPLCIKNNHNKFVRFEFCRRLNYTSNKSRSDLIWSNSTIHPFATTLLNLPNRCLLFCSFRTESVDGAIWANIPLIWRCLQSQAPKVDLGVGIPLGTSLACAKNKKIYVDGTEKNHPILFLSFKISTFKIYLQSQSQSLVLGETNSSFLEPLHL